MIVAEDHFCSWSMMSMRKAGCEQAAPGKRYSFFTARNAIYQGLRFLDLPQGSRVLVPAYVCRAAVDPILAYGAEVVFYSVDRDCKPNFPELERKVCPTTKAAVAVHYFGFPQDVRRMRKFCDGHGIALIEDCAHILTGTIDGDRLGTFGDIAVFSWRKFLPVYDGATLVVNRAHHVRKIDWTKESALFTLKVGTNVLERMFVHSHQPIIQLSHKAFRRAQAIFRKCARSYVQTASMMQAETYSVLFNVRGVNWPMSRLSRWIMNHSNVMSIITRRRQNYQILLSELSSTVGVRPLFAELPADVCPWVFPVVFTNTRHAHLQLRRRGIPAVTWGGVRHPGVPKNAFPEADFLYDNLVLLPVHQCLTDKDSLTISRMVIDLCTN
jgi:perosamine synthetase